MGYRTRACAEPNTGDNKHTGRPLRVVYFAVRDLEYPRNERLRAYLENELSAQVDVVRSVVSGGRIHRYTKQLQLVFGQRKDYDVVVLSEFSLSFFPFSWLLAKRSGAFHIVDFFVGLHETEVGDDKSTDGRSFRARLLAWVDRMAIRSADGCFTDTEARARRFSKLDNGRTSFASLPVGAPTWALDAELSGTRGGRPDRPVHILYYGSYLALHGLSSFVASLSGLGDLDFSLLMIGTGPERGPIEGLVRNSPFSHRVEFLDFAEPEVLVTHITNADVLIGVFGESDKAAEVIANKVWQGLYLGKIVVTRASVALDEIADVAGPLLVQVESSQPREIGIALARASHDLDTATLDVERMHATRAALEALVLDRYATVFSTEPYATAFNTLRKHAHANEARSGVQGAHGHSPTTGTLEK
jgi:hypothetical protein